MNAKVFDGSHWNSLNPDMAAAKKAGWQGAIWKATEGLNFIDPSYVKAKASAAKAGMPFIPYHLGRRVGSGEAEFDFFESVAKPPQGSIVMLDVEAGWSIDEPHSKNWCNRATEKGYRALAYGLPDEVIHLSTLADLFQVAWTSQAVRSPWKLRQLRTGSVPGIGENVDIDDFNGDNAAFAAWFEGDDMVTAQVIADVLGFNSVQDLLAAVQGARGLVLRAQGSDDEPADSDVKLLFDFSRDKLEGAGGAGHTHDEVTVAGPAK